LVGHPDDFLEGDGRDEVVVLVLDLDERGRVEIAVPKLSRQDVAKPVDRSLSGGFEVGELLPFGVFDESGPVADVKVECRNAASIRFRRRRFPVSSARALSPRKGSA
jgi:hypothetical protein